MEKDFRQQELQNCNFIKTILMIMIIFYHSMLFWGNGNWFSVVSPSSTSTILNTIAIWINTYSIHTFTLVSGYIFAYLKFERNHYQKFLPFLLNKSKRLLVPYLFASIVWVIPIGVYFFKWSFSEVFTKFILGTSPAQLWFLLMLFCAFILFYFLANFFKEHDFLGLVVVLGLYTLNIIGRKFIPNFFMIWQACAFAPLFWLGIKIRQKGSDLIRKIPCIVWLALDVGLFVLTYYVLTGSSAIITLLSTGCSFLLHIVGSIFFFTFLQKIANLLPSWKKSKFFNLLSGLTMPIYLFHQQIIYFSIYLLNGLVNIYVHFTINFIVSFTLSFIISYLLKKLKSTKFLIGEK